jgi:protocatechuate 3,4-dioxygenase beta subunit
MESPIPFDKLNSTDTLADFLEDGPKMLITGTVYQADGKTPAAGVVVYAYHTNQEGIYPKAADAKDWGLRHGYLRGWVKTGKDGSYRFYTLRPASYPNRQDPAHIHMTVKEPDMAEYWIDEIVFEDDPKVNATYRSKATNAGGNGIIRVVQEGGLQVARRDIILGKNIEGYTR